MPSIVQNHPSTAQRRAMLAEDDIMGSYEAEGWQGRKGEEWLKNIEPLEGMLSQFNPYLLNFLKLHSALKVADIGCGGGSTTRALSQKSKPGSTVHGYDISPALIEHAQAQVLHGAPHPQFFCADVSRMPLPQRPYDRLVSRFGIMFFQEPLVAFTHLKLLLKPGGIFAFLVWGDATKNPWITAIRGIVQRYTSLPDIQRDAPGPFRYSEPDDLPRLLTAIGFSNIKVNTRTGKLPLGGGLNSKQASQFALHAFSTYRNAIGPLNETEKKNLLDDTINFHAKYEVNGQVLMDYQTHLVTGTC